MNRSSGISTVLDRLHSVRCRAATPTAEGGDSFCRAITTVRRELVPERPAPADVSVGYDGRTGGLEAAAIDRFVLEIRELRFVVDETHYVDTGSRVATLSEAYEIGMVPSEPVPLCETVPVPTCGLEPIQLLYAVGDLDLECDREVALATAKGIVEVPIDCDSTTDESYDIRPFVRLRRIEPGYRLVLHDVTVSGDSP